MKIQLCAFLLSGVFLTVSCHKSATPLKTVNYTLSLRPDSTTAHDCYVSILDNDPADGNINVNSAHELVLARWTFAADNYDSATQRGYIRFDSLSKVPTNATVTSAILYLYGEGPDSSATYPFGNSFYSGSNNPSNGALVQMVTGGTWDQTTITWNNAPSATAAGQDTIPPSTSEWNYNVAVDVTNLVSQQVASPATNYGLVLRLQVENIYRDMVFATSHSADTSERPQLVVQYSVKQ
jgi:hypothetical protein